MTEEYIVNVPHYHITNVANNNWCNVRTPVTRCLGSYFASVTNSNFELAYTLCILQ